MGKSIFYRRHVGRHYIAGLLTAETILAGVPSIVTGLHVAPFLTETPHGIDQLVVQITSPAAVGSKARLGIYRNSNFTSLYPTSLLVETIEFDLDVAGTKTLSISETLPGDDIFWFAFFNSATVTMSRLSSNFWGLFGVEDGVSASPPGGGWFVNISYGPLPVLFPAGAIVSNQAELPAIACRISA